MFTVGLKQIFFFTVFIQDVFFLCLQALLCCILSLYGIIETWSNKRKLIDSDVNIWKPDFSDLTVLEQRIKKWTIAWDRNVLEKSPSCVPLWLQLNRDLCWCWVDLRSLDSNDLSDKWTSELYNLVTNQNILTLASIVDRSRASGKCVPLALHSRCSTFLACSYLFATINQRGESGIQLSHIQADAKLTIGYTALFIVCRNYSLIYYLTNPKKSNVLLKLQE